MKKEKALCLFLFFISITLFSEDTSLIPINDLDIKFIEGVDGYIPEEGFVKDEEMARKIAEIILVSIYGEELIEAKKPFYVKLINDEYWLVKGYLHAQYGGVPYLCIRKSNGEIIKVIHTK